MIFSYSSVRGLSPDAPTTSTEGNKIILTFWENSRYQNILISGSGTTKTTSGDQPTQPGPGSTTAPPGRGSHIHKPLLCQLFDSRANLLPRGVFWVKRSHRTGWAPFTSSQIHFSCQGKAWTGWEVQSSWERLNGSDRLQERLNIPPLCRRCCLQVWSLDLLLFCWWPDGGGKRTVVEKSEQRLMREKVVNEDQNSCVDATASSWEMLVDSDWQQDETATVTCAR